jgi:transposase
MLIKTLLNKTYPLKSFVYTDVQLMNSDSPDPDLSYLLVKIEPRKNSRPTCSSCGIKASRYDIQPIRQTEYISLWGVKCLFEHKPRRVSCKKCGIKVEAVPWSDGKSKLTIPLKLHLARWAKKLSWKEAAESFKVSWESVFRSVKYVVEYGMENRSLDNITAIGVDEVKYKIGHQYLTLVYQIDEGMRRILFIGKDRTAQTLNDFFTEFGVEKTANLKVVCTDMWRPYLKVIKEKASHTLNILDRFHIRKHLNEAIDDVRKEETKSLAENGYEPILKNSRWALMKNPSNRTHHQAAKIKELLQYDLKSIKCLLYCKDFERFWTYTSVTWAEKFFDSWTRNAMRSKIEPFKKKVKMLKNHKTLLLNWFRAEGRYSSGPVEGLNNRVKLTMRKAYGFRELDVLKIALFHQLGGLPEPKSTHRFC